MNSLPDIFHDQMSFQHRFVEGLQNMPQHDGLGVFILVLANATYDREVYKLLKENLEKRFNELEASFSSEMDDAPDDIAVFERLMNKGFSALALREVNELKSWRLQFNELRSYRPTRASNIKIETIHQPFNPDEFHFNKPFLKKEILWEGELLGQNCRLLYNKFPFADYHCILVVEPEECREQFLDLVTHRYVWEFLSQLGKNMPGVGAGYNAFGAGASVNQQHFQTYLRNDAGYPIEHAQWRHNGGDIHYPLSCHRFTDPEESWDLIDSFHHNAQTYNLLSTGQILFILLNDRCKAVLKYHHG